RLGHQLRQLDRQLTRFGPGRLAVLLGACGLIACTSPAPPTSPALPGQPVLSPSIAPPAAIPGLQSPADLRLDVPDQRETLRVVDIAPQQTDSGADTPSEPHLVAFDPALEARGE